MDTEKTVLHNKLYYFASKSEKNMEKDDVIVLVINGVVTQEPVSSLFDTFNIKKDCIRGYSLLEYDDITSDGEFSHNGILINFFNENNQEHYYISRVINPQIIWNNIYLKEQYKRVIDFYITELAQKYKDIPVVAGSEEEVDERPDPEGLEEFGGDDNDTETDKELVEQIKEESRLPEYKSGEYSFTEFPSISKNGVDITSESNLILVDDIDGIQIWDFTDDGVEKLIRFDGKSITIESV